MILAIANQKGGSGKTATAAAIAQAAAHRKESVLAIDLDPQGNLSYCLGAAGGPGSYELLTGTPARRLIQEKDGIHIIPASRSLATISDGNTGAARRLAEALRAHRERYSLIIIDTPPTAGLLQYNALQAAEELLIPVQADALGLQGLYQMIETARLFRQLHILGIIFTRHNERSTLSRQMAEAIKDLAAKYDVPCLGSIREGIAIKEAQALQQNLYSYAPRAKAVQEYMALYVRIQEAHDQAQEAQQE